MAAFSRHQLHRSAFRHAGEMEGCATPCEGSASTAARGNGAGRTLRNRGGMKERGRRCRSRFRSDATKIVAVRTLYRARTARSEEHTSELQSLMRISYAVFCLKKKNKQNIVNISLG